MITNILERQEGRKERRVNIVYIPGDEGGKKEGGKKEGATRGVAQMVGRSN